MPLNADRDIRLYVEDMLAFCQRARSYAAGVGYDALLADTMRYDAILRNLELIGEAATHVEAPLRAAMSTIPWRLIIGTRNRLAHAYLGISPATVWGVLHDDLPALEQALVAVLAAWPPVAP